MLCLPVNAQQTEKIRRLGFLYASTVPLTGGGLAQIKEGLRELGYVEGKISHLSTGMRTGGRIS